MTAAAGCSAGTSAARHRPPREEQPGLPLRLLATTHRAGNPVHFFAAPEPYLQEARAHVHNRPDLMPSIPWRSPTPERTSRCRRPQSPTGAGAPQPDARPRSGASSTSSSPRTAASSSCTARSARSGSRAHPGEGRPLPPDAPPPRRSSLRGARSVCPSRRPSPSSPRSSWGWWRGRAASLCPASGFAPQLVPRARGRVHRRARRDPVPRRQEAVLHRPAEPTAGAGRDHARPVGAAAAASRVP